MNTTLSVCSACHSINRLSIQNTLTKDPICGKCGKKLHLKKLVSEVNSQDFKRLLTKTDKKIIIDFWASWCGPCRSYAPEFEKASTENPDAIFVKINTENEQSLAMELGIRSIPTTLVFQNGKEIKRQSGALSSQMVKSLLN